MPGTWDRGQLAHNTVFRQLKALMLLKTISIILFIIINNISVNITNSHRIDSTEHTTDLYGSVDTLN